METLYGKRKKSDIIAIILISIIVSILLITILLSFFFRAEEKIKVLFKNGKNISVFIAGVTDDKKISAAFVFLFNTETNKSASINILPRTFLQFKQNHYPLEEALNKNVSYDQILKSVGQLIGQNIDYYIFLNKNGFVKLIDMLEGIEIYTNKIKLPEIEVYIPEGVINLDGDKAFEYISFLSSNTLESQYDQLKRIQNLFKGMLKIKPEILEQLNKEIISEYLYKTITTNFSPSDLNIIYQEIKNRYKKNITDFSLTLKNIIVYCDSKELTKDNIIYLPKKGGAWVKSEVNDAMEFLSSKKEASGNIKEKLSIEILNGTDIVGLAIRAKSYLESFGVNVVRVDNANSNDYENSVVIVYGLEGRGKKIAELIKCDRIVIDEDTEKKIDATVILGKDFDGRMVR